MTSLDVPRLEFSPRDAIPNLFLKAAGDFPSTTALIQGDRRVSYGDLARSVCRVANALRALGVERGDRVAILGRNSIEYAETYFGTLLAGACSVPLPSMATSEQLEAMILDSRSKALFCQGALRSSVDGFPERRIAKGMLVAFDFEAPGWRPYATWNADAADTPPGVDIRADDDVNIIYSSGTTGAPKGIVHSHAVRHAFTRGTANFGFGRGAVNLASTPLYSNTTMAAWLPSMCFGATTVLMEKFDAREALRLSAEHRVTHAMLVPTQYERMLRVPDFDSFDLSSYQCKLSTSAPLRAEVKREILARWPGALVEIYSLTEGGVTTLLFASAYPNKLDSVGQASPGSEIRIIDDRGNELPTGSIGEIVGRGPIMMSRYENRPDATSEMTWSAPDGRLFLRSGDVGRLDEDGFLYLLDRKKDMIISGGLNIYAADLESVLLQHPAVREACVIGVPSEEWGETPLALVVREPGDASSEEDLRAWANERLGKSQRISRVELREDLPKSPIGKVLKRELREPYWGEKKQSS